MNWIARIFVRAKHWQIFLLFVVIGAVGELPLIGSLTTALKSPEGSGVVLVLTEAAAVVSGWCFLLWLWSLGSFLNTVVQPELRLRTKVFTFAVIFSAFYFLGSVAFFQSISPSVFLVVPLALWGVSCVFYVLYFVAKNLVMAETRKNASLSGYCGPFLLLCFSLIGVWFIQPRVNRLYSERRNNAPATDAAAI